MRSPANRLNHISTTTGALSPLRDEGRRNASQMDNFRGFEEDVAAAAPDDEPSIERPPEIGVDERRMHVRAYNYWVSLLAGRAYPAIQDVDPHNIEDFGPHSVLLDFSGDAEDPEIAFLGRALRVECGLDAAISAGSARCRAGRCSRGSPTIISRSSPIARRSASRPSSSASAATTPSIAASSCRSPRTARRSTSSTA